MLQLHFGLLDPCLRLSHWPHLLHLALQILVSPWLISSPSLLWALPPPAPPLSVSHWSCQPFLHHCCSLHQLHLGLLSWLRPGSHLPPPPALVPYIISTMDSTSTVFLPALWQPHCLLHSSWCGVVLSRRGVSYHTLELFSLPMCSV